MVHGMIWAHLRRRPGRAVALLASVLMATSGFVVLTGSAETSRLQVVSDVSEHYRSVYDILVRPAGARTALERERSLVTPNFLASQYGGITVDQWRQIEQVPGVEVAAPTAMLGFTPVRHVAEFDVTELLDPALPAQVIRISPVWYGDAELSRAPDDPQMYLYVTRRPVVWPVLGPDEPPAGLPASYDVPLYGTTEGWMRDFQRNTLYQVLTGAYSDGRTREPACQISAVYDTSAPAQTPPRWYPPFEVQRDGTEKPICLVPPSKQGFREPSLAIHWDERGFHNGSGEPSPRLVVRQHLEPLSLVVGVDPQAESRLVGLDDAVVWGERLWPRTPLAPNDEFRRTVEPMLRSGEVDAIPALLATRAPVAESIRVIGERLDLDAAAVADNSMSWLPSEFDLGDELLEATPGTAVSDVVREAPAAQVVEVGAGATALADLPFPTDEVANYDAAGWSLFQSGPVRYDIAADGVLRPRPVDSSPGEVMRGQLAEQVQPLLTAPPQYFDLSFRSTLPLTVNRPYGGWFTNTEEKAVLPLRIAGGFDATRLTAVDPLSGATLDTYASPEATGADEASRAALDGRPLAPTSSPGGYLVSAPSVLVSLWSLPLLMPDRGEPISAVRVRVAGITGFDDISRERVRQVAEDIAQATGLEVDIVLGSSPAPQEVVLPAGEFGRPELRLAELWTLKGVAAAIVSAVDRKSVVLFGLILVVCVLALGNAVAAAVRTRRPELALLSCLGWSRRRIASLVVGETLAVGLLAGLLSVALALPVSWLVGIDVRSSRVWLAIPVALLLAGAASAWPAWRASQTHPAAGLHAPVVAGRRGRRHRWVLSLALSGLWRTPGRTLLAAAALGVGVAGLTLVAAVMWSFHGTIVGSLLGDAVSLRVRGVDVVAVVAILLLGLFAVGDVLYLNVRERAGEFATIRSFGWPEGALVRLVTYEGLGIGVLGALAGGGLGLAAAATFVGQLSPRLVIAAAAAAVVGVALAGLAALVPAQLQRRVAMSALLAEQ